MSGKFESYSLVFINSCPKMVLKLPLCLFLIAYFLSYFDALGAEIDESELDSRFNLKDVFTKSENTVKFFLYNRDKLIEPENFQVKHYRRGIFTNFKNNKPLIVVIHGWLGSDDVSFSKSFREGMLSYKDVNLIAVDWSRYGSKNMLYPLARKNVPVVAQIVANFLDDLSHHHEVRLEEIHVLGHSLGAHIAGLAGNLVKTGKIGRITGFDPAGVLFSADKPDERLSPSSAKFVDVIHTCGNYLGLQAPMGHADFYPNGGSYGQPGCGTDIKGSCSHMRSYLLYIDSFYNSKAFPAVSCPSWEHFKIQQNCDFEHKVYMGEKLSPSARGIFFLTTKEKSPYGLGRL